MYGRTAFAERTSVPKAGVLGKVYELLGLLQQLILALARWGTK
jgi:hypothetical protein